MLGEIAKNDPNTGVRKRAIYYLGQSGDKRAVKILNEILQED
ncbi:MAG: HEAT repeat domain-containing protein [bacterium]